MPHDRCCAETDRAIGRLDGLCAEMPVLSLPTLFRRWTRRDSHPYSIIKLFATLSRRELKDIAPVLHDRSYLEGEVVFDEGEVGQAIYFVLEGTVCFQRALADGQRVLWHMEKGDSFGALALLLDEPRVVQAVAQTNCRLAVFFRSDLHQLMDTRATAAFKLSLEMARHLAQILRRVALNPGSVQFDA